MHDRALIDEIAAHPDDDQPRLVYADVLTERGDPRGELITLQCAIARDERGDAVERPDALVRRARHLLEQHEAAWIANARAILWRRYELRRGMVEKVWANDARDLIAVADALWQCEPVLRAAELGTGFDQLAVSPLLEHFEEIAWMDPPMPSDFAPLADSAHAGRLRRLIIPKPAEEAMTVLAAFPLAIESLVLTPHAASISSDGCGSIGSSRVLLVRHCDTSRS